MDLKKRYLMNDEQYEAAMELMPVNTGRNSPSSKLMWDIMISMRKKKINITPDDTEEALLLLNKGGADIKDQNDLRELIKPAFVKIKEAEEQFEEAFEICIENVK